MESHAREIRFWEKKYEKREVQLENLLFLSTTRSNTETGIAKRSDDLFFLKVLADAEVQKAR
jgi:hypothetical protein